MSATRIIFQCTLLATFFPCFPMLGAMDVTGLWVLEIKSPTTTTKKQMVMISKKNSQNEIKPESGEWEVATIENFQVKDDAITFNMGGIVSCRLTEEGDSWNGECAQDQENDSAEKFTVILRLPEVPASAPTSEQEAK